MVIYQLFINHHQIHFRYQESQAHSLQKYFFDHARQANLKTAPSLILALLVSFIAKSDTKMGDNNFKIEVVLSFTNGAKKYKEIFLLIFIFL